MKLLEQRYTSEKEFICIFKDFMMGLSADDVLTYFQVADFGLAKLVGRTNDEELLATRLVGTPGYLPPEYVLTYH